MIFVYIKSMEQSGTFASCHRRCSIKAYYIYPQCLFPFVTSIGAKCSIPASALLGMELSSLKAVPGIRLSLLAHSGPVRPWYPPLTWLMLPRYATQGIPEDEVVVSFKSAGSSNSATLETTALLASPANIPIELISTLARAIRQPKDVYILATPKGGCET